VAAFDVVALPDDIPVFYHHASGRANLSTNGIEVCHGGIKVFFVDPLTFRTGDLPVFLWKNNVLFRLTFASIDDEKEKDKD